MEQSKISKQTIYLCISSIAFLSCILGANWALKTWGIVPVGFGLMAPAGVYFAGLSFGLRDATQELGGRRWTILLILLGAALSAFIDPVFAFASCVAFLCSEMADFAVYTPLRERHWHTAVIASNAVGAIIDSALFLWIAFGSLEFIAGNTLGKFWMTVPAIIIVGLVRKRNSA